MDFYFVCTGIHRRLEIEPIKELRPKHLMISYHYFKNVDLGEFIKVIGYKPKILLDSGAFSAFMSGKPVNLEKYIEYIKRNNEHIYKYVCMDVLGDSVKSYEAWEQMRARGLDPMPVFQYMGDEAILQKYIAAGVDLIGLGGTVPIKSKREVAAWARLLAWQYPANYHLLGSANRVILDEVDLYSADASTWAMGAIFGRPFHIPGNTVQSRIKRAKYNLSLIHI